MSNGFFIELSVTDAKTGTLELPVFSKYRVKPFLSPTKRSKSPSTSKSAKVSLEFPTPIFVNEYGSLTAEAKLGAVDDPIFSKNMISPSLLPTNKSESPSPLISTNVGLKFVAAVTPKLSPKGSSEEVEKLGTLLVPVFSK